LVAIIDDAEMREKPLKRHNVQENYYKTMRELDKKNNREGYP
jgi:hypothetical protein